MGATIKDLLDCARRELVMRRVVYPTRVAKGRMKEQAAAREIAMMSALVDYLQREVDAWTPLKKDSDGLVAPAAGPLLVSYWETVGAPGVSDRRAFTSVVQRGHNLGPPSNIYATRPLPPPAALPPDQASML